MSSSLNFKVKTAFWFEAPLPFYLNVWLFKVNIISGHGKYTSFQKTPSGVTLRIVNSGEWEINLCGIKRKAFKGDIFCTMPSESVTFSQTEDCQWEWYELQFNGLEAENFIGEFGLSKTNSVITPANPGRALKSFKQINEYFRKAERSVPELLSMLFQLIHVCGKSGAGKTSRKNSSRDDIVTKAIEYLESTPCFNLNINEMAEILKVERSTLYRAFLQKTGKSPHQYIDWLKLNRSEELLLNSKFSLALIAKQTGFPDVKYFSYWFKNKKGSSPGSWRRKQAAASKD